VRIYSGADLQWCGFTAVRIYSGADLQWCGLAWTSNLVLFIDSNNIFAISVIHKIHNSFQPGIFAGSMTSRLLALQSVPATLAPRRAVGFLNKQARPLVLQKTSEI
jgi:hypothetical protein